MASIVDEIVKTLQGNVLVFYDTVALHKILTKKGFNVTKEKIYEILIYFNEKDMLCRVRDNNKLDWLDLFASKTEFVDHSDNDRHDKWFYKYKPEEYVME